MRCATALHAAMRGRFSPVLVTGNLGTVLGSTQPVGRQIRAPKWFDLVE